MARALDQMLEAVDDRASFLAFVKALIADREDGARQQAHTDSPWSAGAHGWENQTIEAYLEAAVAWAEDAQAAQFPLAPSWQAFARFLHSGKLYE